MIAVRVERHSGGLVWLSPNLVLTILFENGVPNTRELFVFHDTDVL